jgi:perosamine synthetase
VIPLSRPYIGDEERAAVDRVLRTGNLAQGPEVSAFEDEFSEFVDARTCVAVNSGTSALHLGLLAAGIGNGDEVILPSFTFAASANAVALCGATPVFADIEPDSFCIDPEAVEAAVTARTAGIMAVHLYGHPADMTRLSAIANRHGFLLVEDAAQAHLATWSGRPVGALGDLAAFSFYPTKNMTTGEGGMIVSSSDDVVRKARLYRNQGMEQRYLNEVVGFNNRMTDIAAAIGRVQLGRVAAWTEQRRKNAAALTGDLRGVQPPIEHRHAEHAYHQYTIRTDDREGLAARLEEAGIGYGIYYPTPVHRLPSFASTADLPETELAAAQVLSLPVNPHLTDAEVTRIAKVASVVG